jgi:hypothetical protein
VNTQQREIDPLQKTFLAQANLKKIVEKFREQMNAAIQVSTATALQKWFEQEAEL